MTALKSEYKFLIRRAVKEGQAELAQQLREWGFEKYDLDLLDYCKHPSLPDERTQLHVVPGSR